MIMATQRSALKDPVGYPDFTLPVSLVAQIIEKLKVDIVAQTIPHIDVDIAAQTVGNINVNLAASTITLDVNIASQAANLNIDIKAQSISVKLVPDWGAIQAEDVDVTGSASVPSGQTTQVIVYTVPAGKTLLIYDWSAAILTSDGQLYGALENATDLVVLSHAGGTRGFQTPLSKPKRVAGGKQVGIFIRHDTGAAQIIHAHFGGTLI